MPSPRASRYFSKQPVIQVRSLGLQRAEDAEILEYGRAENRIVVSADTDFGTLLAQRSSQRPSVIQFRGEGSRAPEALAQIIIVNLSHLHNALETGSVVTFEPARIRVRALPIGKASSGT